MLTEMILNIIYEPSFNNDFMIIILDLILDKIVLFILRWYAE